MRINLETIIANNNNNNNTYTFSFFITASKISYPQNNIQIPDGNIDGFFFCTF